MNLRSLILLAVAFVAIFSLSISEFAFDFEFGEEEVEFGSNISPKFAQFLSNHHILRNASTDGLKTISSSKLIKRNDSPISKSVHQLNVVRYAYSPSGILWMLDMDSRVSLTRDSFRTIEQINLENIERIFSHPEFGNLTYFIAKGNYGYVTTDFGRTVTKVNHDGVSERFLSLRFHPTQYNWLLAQDTKDDIYYSQDLGNSWKLLKAGVVYRQFVWCTLTEGSAPKERVCLIGDSTQKSADSSAGGVAKDSSLLRSDNFGRSFTNMLPGKYVMSVSIKKKHVMAMAKDVSTFETKDIGLYVSANHGATWRLALLPNGLTISYFDPRTSVLDESTGALIIGVNKGARYMNNPSPHHGDIYMSDTSGTRFTSTLQHAVHFKGWWDFHTVQGIPGVFISNSLENWENDKNTLTFKPLVKSLISVDNGRSWNRLRGSRELCEKVGEEEQCYLNLFGKTTWIGFGSGLSNGNSRFYGDIHSVAPAVGLIVGTGNVGSNLEFDPESVNTFVSRNGGWSWDFLIEGSSALEFLDSGALLIVGRTNVLTDTIFFSHNEGSTLIPYTFNEEKVIIIMIFSIDPEGKRAVILATKPDLPEGEYYMIGMDFSGLNTQKCTDTDYYDWLPPYTTSDEKGCVLGQKTTYQRKEASSQCENGPAYQPIKNVFKCNCTHTDYECNYGFERTSVTKKCVMEEDMTWKKLRELECSNPTAENTYVASGSYRKVPGDKCMYEDPQYAPQMKSCNAGLSWFWTICITLMLFIAIATIIAYIVRSTNLRYVVPALFNSIPHQTSYMPVNNSDPDVDGFLMDDDDDEDLENPNDRQ